MAKKYDEPEEKQISQELFKDISALIEQSRKRVALRVNREMTLLNWHIGKAISTRILGNRAMAKVSSESSTVLKAKL
jgi:hypothetical protein